MATGKNITEFDIADVSGGCNYSDDITTLAKNQSPDSMNVEFFNGRLKKRLGEMAFTTVPSGTGSVSISYLVVAGGAGGGCGNNAGAGGGAGGVVTGSTTTFSGQSYPIVIGAGGAGGTAPSGDGADGSNSTFNGVTAVGGGGGVGPSAGDGHPGGSGGGGQRQGGVDKVGGAGTAGQGNKGGDSSGFNSPNSAAGGGGAGAAGGNQTTQTAAGNGGNGTASSISGVSVTYGGGGGGGASSDNFGSACTAGTGGTGGGGAGADSNPGSNGTANTGGGGGGGGWKAVGFAQSGGSGGSGVVIISYATPALDNGTGGTISHAGGNTIHTFTTDGTFVPPVTVATSFVGFSLIDFSDTSRRHRQVVHIGNFIYAYDRLTNTADTLRSSVPAVRSFNAKVSSYLIQTYTDFSAPYYWDGAAASMAIISANAPGFKRAIEFQGYMIGMNTSANPTRCYYQPIGNLLGAGAAYTDYFTLTPAPNDDEITDPFLLNGRLYAGTKYGIFRISFVGGVTVFEFKQVISDVGIVPGTAQTVITKDFGQVVLFLGTDKRMYLFDGANIKTISDLYYYHNKTTPIALDLIDDSYKENSFAVYDLTRRIYRLFVTKKASSTNYYCLNVDVDTFAYYPFDHTSFSCGAICYDALLRPSVVCVDYTGILHKMFIDTPTDNGTAINEYYTSPLVSKKSAAIKKGDTINLHMVPVSNANLQVYDKIDFTRAWQFRQSIPLASPRDKYLGTSFVLGSAVLGSEKDLIFPQIGINASFNDYQFKLSCDTPTAQAWEILDIDVNQEMLMFGRAEAQR